MPGQYPSNFNSTTCTSFKTEVSKTWSWNPHRNTPGKTKRQKQTPGRVCGASNWSEAFWSCWGILVLLRRFFVVPTFCFFFALGCVNDSGFCSDFDTYQCKALVNPISNVDSVTSPKTRGMVSGWLNMSAKLSLPHKMLSHWNWLLHCGICSMFPNSSGSECNKICCHKKDRSKSEKKHIEDRNRRERVGK